MPDVIICADFGMEKLMGLGNTGGQSLGSPIETTGHPYNSAALPLSLWYNETDEDEDADRLVSEMAGAVVASAAHKATQPGQ